MNLLSITYDKLNNSYSYTMNKSAPSNCHILDYSFFSEIDLNDRFILFIGSVWYGVDMATANALSEIATRHQHTKLYFKLIMDELELPNVVPKEVVFTHLPIVLFIDKLNVKVISAGPMHKYDLEKKINELRI